MDDMSTTTATTYARFLDVLADALGDHEVSADDLAARVHLSRFHLDRVVAAAGGEPPAHLRRRLLLERAAYRLANTDLTILDIAVESGYGSHEAFTRAFTRGFGVGPKVWRAAPTGFVIEATNGVHFHPPGSIRLPATDKVSAMELLQQMVDHHIWLTGELIEHAGRLTDAQLDEHIAYGVDDDPDVMTLRNLLSRLVGQMAMWNAEMAHEDYDWSLEDHETIDSMRQRLDRQAPIYKAHVRDAIEHGRLGDTFVNADENCGQAFTYGGMIAHVLTFAAHRRTLAVRALAGHGIEDLGWGDPAEWIGNRAS